MKHTALAALGGAFLLTQGVAIGGETYAEDLRGTDLLVSFPATDPLTQTSIDPDIGATGWYTYAMDFNTAGTVLYVINNVNSGSVPPTWDLGMVDPDTGVYTYGPAIPSLLGPSSPSGLSMDPTDETLYMCTPTELYTLDPVTGGTVFINNFIGTTPAGLGVGTVIDIAINASGQMYAHDIGNDCLWAVDKATGTSTYISTSNLAANFAQGMDFDPDTDLLYAAIYTGGGTGVYGTWDTTTGVITTIELLPNIPDFSVELELAIRTAPAVDPGVPYCFGDGSGTACPCGNVNDGSLAEAGCANGQYASGARLTGTGVASIGADTLVLMGEHTENSQSGLYFQANNDLSPGNVWGDGLQCAGGQLKRLGVRFSDATGYSDTSAWTTPISVKAGNVLPGDTKYYQLWYRNPFSSPCGNEFNASNGYAVTWMP